MPEQQNTLGSHERALEAVNKSTKSIVNLMRRLGVREAAGASERPLWNSRKKLWDSVVADIQKTEQDIDAKYRGTEKQNIALLNYVRNRIIGGEMLDRKTLTFVRVGEKKAEVVAKAGAERAEVKKEVEKKAPMPKREKEPVKRPPIVIPSPGRNQEYAQKAPVETKGNFENGKEIVREIGQALELYFMQNKNRPYDTSVDGADGYSRSKFRKTGSTQVLDNITGEIHDVSRDPKKATRVVDQFGREKLLTGEPAICDDVITEFLNKVGIRTPYERSVAILERVFQKNKENFTMFKQGLDFQDYGKEFKPTVPCQVGDIMTSSRGPGRHIFIVTKVDGNGIPTEVMDASAVNQGIGKRPFIGKTPAEDFTNPDFHGHPRSRGVIGPGVTLNYIIRPRYKKINTNLVASSKDV